MTTAMNLGSLGQRRELARAVGISYTHIKQIWRGERGPSLRLAVRIARYLGITVEELVDELEKIRAECLERRKKRGWLGVRGSDYPVTRWVRRSPPWRGKKMGR